MKGHQVTSKANDLNSRIDRLKQCEVGSKEFFEIQRLLIKDRALLNYCYQEWYRLLLEDEASVPAANKGELLELGSGGSYLQELEPEVITSDVVEGVADRVVDAQELPFDDNSLRAIFATHTIHHIPEVTRFFSEAERVLVPNGVIALIEVAHTPLSRALFTYCHPEPYDHKRESWHFEQDHSMLDANQALSWMMFKRDKALFDSLFPSLEVEIIEYLPWLSYVLSGGVTQPCYVPRWLQGGVLYLDRALRFLDPLCGLHWHIRIRKKA